MAIMSRTRLPPCRNVCNDSPTVAAWVSMGVGMWNPPIHAGRRAHPPGGATCVESHWGWLCS